MGIFSKKTYIGLDLGHHTIKVIELDPTGNGWRVARLLSTATPSDSVKDGVVVDQGAVTQTLKNLLRENHINSPRAHIAVAGGSVVVRSVRMPKMSEATLRKSIKFEASRYVPTSVEDSYVEFEILGPVDEGQMEVLVVAAPKDIVESRIKACEEAGIEVEGVDVEAFAMYRALIETYDEPIDTDTTIALVDIGATMTNMSVIRNGVFAMTRSIPNGGQVLTEALKSYFKLADQDAELGKTQLDASELVSDKPQENPPLRVLQPHLDDLIREIRRSLNYYQSQQSDKDAQQVSRVLLAGGGSKMPGLAEYVQHKLSLPTSTLPLFGNPRFTHSGPTEETGLELAVASGLAMRAFARAA